jgi:hypothetical protein
MKDPSKRVCEREEEHCTTIPQCSSTSDGHQENHKAAVSYTSTIPLTVSCTGMEDASNSWLLRWACECDDTALLMIKDMYDQTQRMPFLPAHSPRGTKNQ